MNKQPGDLNHDWQTVWHANAKWLRTVLIARLRDALVADELLQEVAVIAWRKRDQLTDPEKIEPWLYRIAIRQIQMFWRKRASVRQVQQLDSISLETPDERQDDPLTWLTACESHQRVRDAVNQMSNQDREILMLKHTEGWTYQQIADRLGVSVDKIIYRSNRARQRLRTLLAAYENEWAGK